MNKWKIYAGLVALAIIVAGVYWFNVYRKRQAADRARLSAVAELKKQIPAYFMIGEQNAKPVEPSAVVGVKSEKAETLQKGISYEIQATMTEARKQIGDIADAKGWITIQGSNTPEKGVSVYHFRSNDAFIYVTLEELQPQLIKVTILPVTYDITKIYGK